MDQRLFYYQLCVFMLKTVDYKDHEHTLQSFALHVDTGLHETFFIVQTYSVKSARNKLFTIGNTSLVLYCLVGMVHASVLR